MPRALITGITGQDGSYLTELLLAQGYEVHGVVRPAGTPASSWLHALCSEPKVVERRLFLHTADLEDTTGLRNAFGLAKPDEVYHLAGQSHVGLSFAQPELTARITALATVHLLQLAREMDPRPRFFHASSSEIFGEPAEAPQTEETPIAPVNPYGCAKAFATQMVRVYRRSHGLFACNGILFNHESPRRGETFVTRKICRGAAAISLGLEQELLLGDATARRDWGHARDYVRGMHLALQHTTPEDFVFATGQTHSVQDVVERAFATVKLDWRKHVRHDPSLSRPTEPRRLVGDAGKAQRLLGWAPQTTFDQMITEMTIAEVQSLSAAKYPA